MNIKWSSISGFGPSAWNQNSSLSAVRVVLPRSRRKTGAADSSAGSQDISAENTEDKDTGLERTAA